MVKIKKIFWKNPFKKIKILKIIILFLTIQCLLIELVHFYFKDYNYLGKLRKKNKINQKIKKRQFNKIS